MSKHEQPELIWDIPSRLHAYFRDAHVFLADFLMVETGQLFYRYRSLAGSFCFILWVSFVPGNHLFSSTAHLSNRGINAGSSNYTFPFPCLHTMDCPSVLLWGGKKRNCFLLIQQWAEWAQDRDWVTSRIYLSVLMLYFSNSFFFKVFIVRKTKTL